MELICCGTKNAVLILSCEDMKKYRIDRDSGADISKKLRILLADCENSEGLIHSPELLVKIFDLKEGGCELFITGFEEIYQTADFPCTQTYIYRFDSTERLICACRALKALGYTGESSVYKDEGKPFLYLTLDRVYDNLSEFEGVCLRKRMFPYIDEHCRKIKGACVETLCSL